MKTIKGYKGFTKNLKCKGFQYTLGKEFKHSGDVMICKSGFHFCEHPLDVFEYYSPTESRFAEIEASGTIDKEGDGDTKIACSQIRIGAELSISTIIDAAVKFVFERAKWGKKKCATGYRGAASATGDSGAASATGDRGAASATGYRGAASATGQNGIASSLGINGMARGSLGVWLVLSEWKKDKNEKNGWKRIDVKTALVDGMDIKIDTFYCLDNGKFTICG